MKHNRSWSSRAMMRALLFGICAAASGCASQPTAVPSVVATDETEWICPGVPAESAQIITGQDPEIETTGDPYGMSWICTATSPIDPSVDGSRISVLWGLLRDSVAYKYTGEESTHVRFPENVWTVPGVEGSGSWSTSTSNANAQWVCADRYVEVWIFLDKKQRERRDPSVDARNLLTSILPWVCGTQPIPGATTTPTSTLR